jgi:HAMP domain-containing protein
MAQYSFNPNSLATGLNPIGNGWTQRMNAPNTSAIIATTTPVGNKAWAYTSLTHAAIVSSFDAVPSNTTDCEVLLLARTAGATGNVNDLAELGAVSRMGGTAGLLSGHGRALRFSLSAFARKWLGTGSSSYTELTHSLEYLNNSWYWIKLQSNGTTHRARYRADGTLEPFEWVQSVTDTDYLSGGCGLGGFHNPLYGNLEVAWFSVGTAGDTAPLPPGLASDADLYAHWKFDETSGTSAADSSLSSNTLTTTDVTWADGEIDGAASFNGTSSRADCPHHASLQVADEVTLSAWVYPTANGQSSASLVAGKGESGIFAYSLRFTSGGTVRTDLRIESSTIQLISVATLPLDEWSHIAVTWKRLSSGNNRFLYINGTLAASDRVADPLRALENQTHRFAVGSPYIEIDRANRRFTGRIDDVRVYKRALPAAEVAALATYHLAPGATTITPIVMNYHQLLRA